MLSQEMLQIRFAYSAALVELLADACATPICKYVPAVSLKFPSAFENVPEFASCTAAFRVTPGNAPGS
jgi:hypothetical protein